MDGKNREEGQSRPDLIYLYIDVLLQRLARCWSFMSWQHLRSYPDGYRLVTNSTHLWRLNSAAPLGDSEPSNYPSFSYISLYTTQRRHIDLPTLPYTRIYSSYISLYKYKCICICTHLCTYKFPWCD